MFSISKALQRQSVNKEEGEKNAIKSKLRQTGFTLVELIMVIAIIGILAAVALPRFVNLQGQAQVAAAQGSLGSVRSALAIRYAQNAANGTAAYPGGTGGGAALAGGDFADGQIPRNALQGTAGPRGINPLADATAIPAGTATDAANGFWYYSGGANAGRAGAYSDAAGATNTSAW